MKARAWPGAALGVLLLLVACQTVTELPAAACTGPYTAVLTLITQDPTSAPLTEVSVSYRQDGGVWEPLPERVYGRTTLSLAPGSYQFRASKPAYESVETAVIIPTPVPPACNQEAPPLILQLPPAICSLPPQPILLEIGAETAVSAETADLQVTALHPLGASRPVLSPAPCAAPAADCVQFATMPVDVAGSYNLGVRNLPGEGVLRLEGEIVQYDYQPITLTLRYGRQTQQLRVTGATQASLTVPVTLDETGCPLADLRALTAEWSPNISQNEPYPPVSVDLLGGMTMTDLGNPACQAMPAPKQVLYELTLPAGTRLSAAQVRYWLDGDWQNAPCAVENGRILCTAVYPHPYLRQPYAVRAVVDGRVYSGTQLPFSNLCILFRP